MIKTGHDQKLASVVDKCSGSDKKDTCIGIRRVFGHGQTSCLSCSEHLFVWPWSVVRSWQDHCCYHGQKTSLLTMLRKLVGLIMISLFYHDQNNWASIMMRICVYRDLETSVCSCSDEPGHPRCQGDLLERPYGAGDRPSSSIRWCCILCVSTATLGWPLITHMWEASTWTSIMPMVRSWTRCCIPRECGKSIPSGSVVRRGGPHMARGRGLTMSLCPLINSSGSVVRRPLVTLTSR